MVAESHRLVSSFSKLTLELGLGSTLQLVLADQTTRGIAEGEVILITEKVA